MASTTPNLLSAAASAVMSRGSVGSVGSGSLGTKARKALEAPSLVGVVVSAGRMQRAVKVHTVKQRRDTFLQRHYRERLAHLVSDPADSLRTGDVVRITPWRTSRRIFHVVTEIIKPFGSPADARPPIPSIQDLIAKEQTQWEAKQERRAARRTEENARRREVAEADNPINNTAAGAQHRTQTIEPTSGASGGESGLTANEKQRRTDRLENEALAQVETLERIEKKAEQQGIDLNKRMEGLRT